MKRISLALLLTLILSLTLKAQEEFVHKKDGYSITFPSNSKVKKSWSRYYKDYLGIRYMIYKTGNYDETLGWSTNSGYDKFNEYKTGNYRIANVYNKLTIDVPLDMVGILKPTNMWIFETDNGSITICVSSIRPGAYPDLSTVYPFIASLKLENRNNFNIPISIAEENLKYNGPKIGDGITQKSQTIVQNNSQNQLIIQQNNEQAIPNSNNTTIELAMSDIDKDIPIHSKLNKNTFAVIIGNENYDNEITVKFAKNDAAVFKKYAENTLGIPNEQVHYLENASYGQMLKEITWINSVAKAFEGEAKLIFYYAGHGMPDQSTKDAYILPVDGEASQTITAISLEKLYSSLNEHPTKQVTVFLDACFSGAAREGMLASGRGVKIVPKKHTPQGNMVVFSAVSGDQTAHPYEEKNHGLFSYFLMKKIQESKGKVTYGELSDYIKSEVNKKSVISGKEQTPQVNVSVQLQDSWKEWTFE